MRCYRSKLLPPFMAAENSGLIISNAVVCRRALEVNNRRGCCERVLNKLFSFTLLRQTTVYLSLLIALSL